MTAINRNTRGQTTLDFAIGVSVFLLALVFVFAFVQGTLLPFTDGAQEETVSSNRVADLLVKDLLVDTDRPYILNGTCTAALLSDDSGNGCGFDGATLPARLDIADDQSINVSMRGDPDGDGDNGLLCWDAGTGTVLNSGHTDCNTDLTYGPAPPTSADTAVTARRLVDIEEMRASIEVNMW